MADQPGVVESEITLDDFNADEKPSEKAESTPAPKAEEKSEVKPEKAQEKETKDDSPVAAPPDVPTKKETDSEPKPAEETEIEEPPQEPTKADARKQQLNTEIRSLVQEKNDLVTQRNEIKAEVERLNAETYQPATEDELVEGGMTDIEAKVEAMRQERELEKFNSQVADAQLTIASESDRVLRDFPLFNPENENYDKELAEEAAEHLSEMLVVDPNTEQVIGVNGSIYKYYNSLARATGISAAKGQIKGQRDTEKQLANADAPTGAAPPKEAKDPLMELWKSDD